MAVRFVSARYLQFISKHGYATKAATISQAEALGIRKDKPKLSTLPNGLNIITQETDLPICNISIIAKVGSKDEGPDQLGVTHCIRSMAGLDTEHSTIFRITRSLQLMGASLKVTNNREYTIYSVDCLKTYAPSAAKYIYEIAFESAFKHWQLSDYAPKLKIDLEVHRSNPLEVLYEKLHEVAFKGGLSNSLYTPDYMIGKHSSQMLEEFVCQHYTPKNLVLVSQGIGQEELTDLLNPENLPPVLEAPPSSGASKYKHGELRMRANLPHVYTALVSEGAGYKNSKEYLSQAVLKEILGTSPRLEHGENLATKLGKTTANLDGLAQCISQSYADTGLFGLLVASKPESADKVVKSCVATMKDVLKSSPSDSDLAAAKQKVRLGLLQAESDAQSGAESLAKQHLMGHQELQSLTVQLDAITAADVAAAGAKIGKTKPTLVTLGKLDKAPHHDELF